VSIAGIGVGVKRISNIEADLASGLRRAFNRSKPSGASMIA
jgi:hypothetical protein